MRKSAASALIFSGAVLFGTALSVQAQITYPGCANITNADFKLDTLLRRGSPPHPTLAEPDKMSFDMDDSGYVDVYFTEIRTGNIKRYNAKTKTVTHLVKLAVWGKTNGRYRTIDNGVGNVEEGVTGIVLDPNFKTNKWLYVHWSPDSTNLGKNGLQLPANDASFRISRFTVSAGANGDTILTSSEKVLVEIPGQRDECCHTGGGMAFDAYGDLWFTVGNNSGRGSNSPTGSPPTGLSEVQKFRSDEWGASSTKGLRGGISRIHPDNSPRGYSIPAGNFGEYFAAKTGNAQYLDTSKVSPEIFIKGNRNPYSLTLDPVRRWVTWGDVGPDEGTVNQREEVNLRKTPGFEGWPYFVGKNTPFSGRVSSPKDTNAPTNTSKWNTGLTTLPPARPAFKLHTLGSSPHSGPIYRYDGDSKSSVKMPPHFNRKWFVTNWGSGAGIFRMYTLSDSGDSIIADQAVFPNISVNGPVDFQAGPDGAFYIMNYGTSTFVQSNSQSLVKISYIGTCRDTTLKLETVGIKDYRGPGGRFLNRESGLLINLRAGQLVSVPEGKVAFQLFDVSGRMVWEITSLKKGQVFKLPELLRSGAFKYRWLSSI